MSDRLSVVRQFDEAKDEDDKAWLDEPTFEMEIDIEFSKKRFTSVTFTEPRAKHIERAERELNVPDPTSYHFRKYQLAMIAANGKLPPEVVGEFTNTQINRAWDFLAAKLREGIPRIGGTSSPTLPDSGDGDRLTPGSSTERN